MGLGVIGIALVVIAVIFTESLTTSRVADNAASLHWANATTGVSATARASAVQANMLIAGADLGIVDDANAAAAVEEARTHFDSLQQWRDLNPNPELTVLVAALDSYVSALDLVVVLLEAQNTAGAAETMAGSLEQSWRSLEIELQRAQKNAVDQVAATEGLAGLLGFIARVALSLVIPIGAVVIYRIRARQQLREAKGAFDAEITAQQRLAAEKTSLISGVSHELRTPLTSIFGFAEVLAASGYDDEVTEMAAVIRSESRTLRRRVDDFVTASRLSDGSVSWRPVSVPLAELAEAEIEATGNAIIHLNVVPASVEGDPGSLAQILRNLVSNAVHHGGDTVWVSGELRGSTYHLAVSDNGAGIDTNAVERAFQPFSNSTEEAVTTGSVGLGLYVSRGLAKLHGGDVRYARDDGWTHFVITLPDAVAQSESANAAQAA
jgi:signal transduction histidine kinase